MRNNREYQLCKAISQYLNLQYPDVLYHYDLAGLNLSRAQAGMTKAIQKRKGWPDLFIAKDFGDEFGHLCSGLFLEIKAEGTRLFKRDGSYATEHLAEQAECLKLLENRGYMARFAIGFDQAKQLIDEYLKP